MHQVSWPSKYKEKREFNFEWNFILNDYLLFLCVLLQKEREAYEVIIEEGKLMYKQSQQIIDTSEGPKSDKWIFVLSTSKSLYVGKVHFYFLACMLKKIYIKSTYIIILQNTIVYP